MKSSYLLDEQIERKRQLEKIAPIRERFLKLLHESDKEKIDNNTVKLIVKR